MKSKAPGKPVKMVQVHCNQACSFFGVDYPKGKVHPMPEKVTKEWFFQALAKAGKVVLVMDSSSMPKAAPLPPAAVPGVRQPETAAPEETADDEIVSDESEDEESSEEDGGDFMGEDDESSEEEEPAEESKPKAKKKSKKKKR